MQTQRTDGSGATSHAWSLSRDPYLQGVDILSWPADSVIWPDGDYVRSSSFDLSSAARYVNAKFHPDRNQSVTANSKSPRSLFNVQGGLIRFEVAASTHGVGSNDYDDTETHIFSMENGDDWFYFEDALAQDSLSSKGSDKPYPFGVSTISSTETEVLRLKYDSRPKYTVVHKGACSFTGIDTSAGQKSSQMGRGHSGFTVQVNVDDL
jgi:hypothetical protein